jgi:AcrR family transcriptional regulator
MPRTRDALLDAARSVVERDGLRALTMAAVAARAGLAKATLYNHFRTRSDVVEALVAREIEAVGSQALAAARAEGAAAGLEAAARCVGQHGAVRRVAGTDPAALVRLAALPDGPISERARSLVAEVLSVGAASGVRGVGGAVDVGAAAAGDDGLAGERAWVDLVLHWLAAQLLAPQDDQARRWSAALLAGRSET